MRLALLTVSLVALLDTSAVAQPAPGERSATSSKSLMATAQAEAAKIAAQQENATPNGARADDRELPQDPGVPSRTRLQLGVSLKGTMTPGIDTNNSLTPTFVWRWRGKGSRIDDRWAPAYRLSSFSSRVASQIGALELPVGDVKSRPLMVGLDYKMPRGKWNWAAGMSAGWAINNVVTHWEYRAHAADATGADDLWVDVHNSFVWGPRLKGWYDVDRRLSFMVESAYLVTRPLLDVRANGVMSSRRLNADAFILKAGVVYGIF